VSQYDSEGYEIRNSAEFIFENYAFFGSSAAGELSTAELKRLQISQLTPCENELELLKELNTETPNFFEKLVKHRGEFLHKRLTEYQAKVKEYEKNWNDNLRLKLDQCKIRILSMLISGEVCAEAIQIPKGDDIMQHIGEAFSFQESLPEAFKNIKFSDWVSFRTNWEHSMLETEKTDCYVVRFNGEEILKALPPKSKKPYQLDHIGDFLFSEKKVPVSKTPPRSGRPQIINWRAIDIRVAEWIYKEKGLMKQEFLAVEIRDWYLNETGHEISLQAIKAKLKNYYQSDVFKKII